jgi:two-component system OmpR family sensor kinase
MIKDQNKVATEPNTLNEMEKFFRDIEIEFLIHELKDPIAIIETGMRALLERRDKYGPLSTRQEKTLKRVLRNTQKARAMLYGLLEVGRSESGCFDLCRFQPDKVIFEVLLEALEMMASGIYDQLDRFHGRQELIAFLRDNGVGLDIPPHVAEWDMLQDQTKFRQIAGNLIKNALHHSRSKVEVRLDRRSDRLFVEVIDDGPGIDPEDHEKIFRRYAQGKECVLAPRNGHGLGLAGARVMARCLGGDIELISREGQGATFRLELPVELKLADKR